jgi:hypothetical protein
MVRRSIFSIAIVIAIMLALAAPALAGGWAVITLDSLPKEVRAGQTQRIGFVIRQHGKELVNTDWDGRALKPVLTAHKKTASRTDGTLVMVAAPQSKGGDEVRVEARQEGAKGHFVADVVFPSAGTWEWQISAPPFYIQNTAAGGEGNAAIFEPLTVLPATAPAAAPAQSAAPEPAAQPPEPTILGLSPAVLRWGGALLLLVAVMAALASQRGVKGRRGTVQPQ